MIDKIDMIEETVFSKLKPGDIFQPSGHPEYRFMKLDMGFVSLNDYKLHLNDEEKLGGYFVDYGNIFMYREMFVDRIYTGIDWKIVSKEDKS